MDNILLSKSKEEILRRVGSISQIASIKSCELTSGRENGVKTFDISTGSGFDFTILESKCLDIYKASYKGVNLSFASKAGLVSPEFHNPHGVEFLRNFQGGLLYTCGLRNAGPACKDDGEDLSLHGRINHAPAENIRTFSGWEDNTYVMKVAGEMRESALFNENLVLRREISTELGAKSLKIKDEVENLGFREEPLMLLYHINLGYPLLDEGAEFVVPALKTVPRDAAAAPGIDEFMNICSPVDNYNEQVFYHEMASDSEGNTMAALINKSLNIGLYVKYNSRQLPKLVQWKSMSPGDYALGIEPANCYPEGRVKEKERGTLHKIGSMEKRHFELEIGILDGMDEINEFKKSCEALKL
jgi:hypothetical protein